MAQLAVRHVIYNAVCDGRPIRGWRQEDKLCIRIDQFADEPRAGDAVDFNFLASNPFHNLHFLSYGFLVLVCSYRGGSLWRTSNLHPNGGRSHRRRSRWICCRSDSRIFDLTLSRISLANKPVGPKIDWRRNFLLRSDRGLRWRG